MTVGILRVRLLVRGARSLKDKRQVLRGVTDRLKGTYNVSVAEVGDRDQYQLIELGIAAVGTEDYSARDCLDKIQSQLRAHPVAEYLGGEVEYV